jgi:hypothetical protein
MKDSQILSTFGRLRRCRPPPGRAGAAVRRLPGVVLRAVCSSRPCWRGRAVRGGQLHGLAGCWACCLRGPAGHAGLAGDGCALKRPLARLPMAAQYTAGGLLVPWPACTAAPAGADGLRTHALAGQRLHRRPAGRPAGGQPGAARARPHPGGHHGAWPSCSRASGRTFCSTRSTAPSPWCGRAGAAEEVLEDLATCSAPPWPTRARPPRWRRGRAGAPLPGIEQVRFGERLRVPGLDPEAGRRGCRRCCCSRWSRTRQARRGAQRRAQN